MNVNVTCYNTHVNLPAEKLADFLTVDQNKACELSNWDAFKNFFIKLLNHLPGISMVDKETTLREIYNIIHPRGVEYNFAQWQGDNHNKIFTALLELDKIIGPKPENRISFYITGLGPNNTDANQPIEIVVKIQDYDLKKMTIKCTAENRNNLEQVCTDFWNVEYKSTPEERVCTFDSNKVEQCILPGQLVIAPNQPSDQGINRVSGSAVSLCLQNNDNTVETQRVAIPAAPGELISIENTPSGEAHDRVSDIVINPSLQKNDNPVDTEIFSGESRGVSATPSSPKGVDWIAQKMFFSDDADALNKSVVDTQRASILAAPREVMSTQDVQSGEVIEQVSISAAKYSLQNKHKALDVALSQGESSSGVSSASSISTLDKVSLTNESNEKNKAPFNATDDSSMEVASNTVASSAIMSNVNGESIDSGKTFSEQLNNNVTTQSTAPQVKLTAENIASNSENIILFSKHVKEAVAFIDNINRNQGAISKLGIRNNLKKAISTLKTIVEPETENQKSSLNADRKKLIKYVNTYSENIDKEELRQHMHRLGIKSQGQNPLIKSIQDV